MNNFVAIMQPTFLPWLGYFDLMDQVKTFIFLDNVQFEKQSWQQRNRIRTANGLEWLTVPVFINGKFGQNITDVEIADIQFPKKQLKTLENNYSRTKYFYEYWPKFEKIFKDASLNHSLLDLNTNLIKLIAELLEISCRLEMASDYGPINGRIDRLIELISRSESVNYLSPVGSKDYLLNDLDKFNNSDISVYMHKYLPIEYEQLHSPFLDGASAIDVLFNCGAKASVDMMRKNRMIPDKLTINSM
jgi:hypothetical protein